jgi:hypothetical protein
VVIADNKYDGASFRRVVIPAIGLQLFTAANLLTLLNGTRDVVARIITA